MGWQEDPGCQSSIMASSIKALGDAFAEADRRARARLKQPHLLITLKTLRRLRPCRPVLNRLSIELDESESNAILSSWCRRISIWRIGRHLINQFKNAFQQPPQYSPLRLEVGLIASSKKRQSKQLHYGGCPQVIHRN